MLSQMFGFDSSVLSQMPVELGKPVVEALAPVSSNVHVPDMFRLLLLLKVLSLKKLLGLKSPRAVNEACEERKTKRFVIYRSGILLPYEL